MRKKIYKRLKAYKNHPFIWRIEGAVFPYSAEIKWSRSTPGSSLTLDTGVILSPKINLGVYDRRDKEYDVDLSDGSIVFLFPTEITLQTEGTATVLIAIDCEFNGDDRIRPVPKGELQVVRENQLADFPVIPVDITAFENELN